MVIRCDRSSSELLSTPSLPSQQCRADRPDSFEIVGRSVTLVGREEVVLRCGEASLALRADGQMTLKGKNLMSRASETNKVRGATVLIN
jgi:hypothetical protein